MISTSSGSAHLATWGRRWSMISVGSSRTPGFGTTHASGRSTHLGCGTAMTAASRTLGCDMIMFMSHRSEEHTSELQSHSDLVCRLLLEKKKKKSNKRQAS